MSQPNPPGSNNAASTASTDTRYDPVHIESKWQEKWEKSQAWKAEIAPSRKKFYVLCMFPYPSGRLHMGHVRNYTIGDVIARFRRAQGFNVLHPMGWDAFGLPAENAAIKHKVHPEKWTLENIQSMKRQLSRLGLTYDWSREIATCLPEYYKWEQLIFTQLFEKGLAYKRGSSVNWCPSCATVLANEQVEDGRCWRCESETTTRELEQWFLKTTAYAEELLKDLDRLENWPERTRLMQKNWIGRSEGVEMSFALENSEKKIDVFTTRPDTLYGVTYLAVAPEHPYALELSRGKPQEKEVQAFAEKSRKQDKIERTAEDAPKEGVFTGSFAMHPLTGEKIPVWVANFVLMDYGTGALMAVPAHDTRDHAFAKKYKLPIKEVIQPIEKGLPGIDEQAFTDAGVLVNSGRFDGMASDKAISAIAEELEKQGKGKRTVNYKLRDWGLSRQRYWGAPIPIVYCEECGTVPLPKEQLPIELPKDVDLSGEGGSPLAKHPDFVKTKCPKCGGEKARRETDTMDTFMESSWYYLRYLSPNYDQAPFSKEDARYWLSIDQYIGGIEHATMHLLYFRFFHKALRDLGYFPEGLEAIDRDEPARNLMHQGIVYKDGAKMSKSKGNVVEPDSIIGHFGADTARLFSMFAAPPEKVLEWTEQGVEGSYRFLGRVWRMVHNHLGVIEGVDPFAEKHSEISHEPTKKLRVKTHETIAKVEGDLEKNYQFNTAIAAIMELVNEIYSYQVQLANPRSRAVLREAIETTVRLLNPFAPHVTEELWERLGQKEWLSNLHHPKADPDALVKDVVTVVIQVNGKLRGEVQVSPELPQEQIVSQATADPRVSAHLEGKTVVKTIYVKGRLINFVVK